MKKMNLFFIGLILILNSGKFKGIFYCFKGKFAGYYRGLRWKLFIVFFIRDFQ